MVGWKHRAGLSGRRMVQFGSQGLFLKCLMSINSLVVSEGGVTLIDRTETMIYEDQSS